MIETGGITLIKQTGQQDDSYCQARVNPIRPGRFDSNYPIIKVNVSKI